jgi:MFS superfamily sulfate permease-like transporter
VLFRWESLLSFANAEIFRERLLAETAEAATHARRVVVTVEPMTDINLTAVDMLCDLQQQLAARDITLRFVEMKGAMKDRLRRYGVWKQLAEQKVFPTIGQAVRNHLAEEGIDWSDPWTANVVTDE